MLDPGADQIARSMPRLRVEELDGFHDYCFADADRLRVVSPVPDPLGQIAGGLWVSAVFPVHFHFDGAGFDRDYGV